MLPTWETDGSKRHYGKKASQPRPRSAGSRALSLSKMVRERFEERINKSEVSIWPANSPHLNQTEYLWEILDDDVTY